MVTKDYSKSRMRENRTYGSVRGGQSNLIPSTRLWYRPLGDEYEVSVTGLAFFVIWHEKHSGEPAAFGGGTPLSGGAGLPPQAGTE